MDANRRLGFKDDQRSYECVAFILQDMGIKVRKFGALCSRSCMCVLPEKSVGVRTKQSSMRYNKVVYFIS